MNFDSHNSISVCLLIEYSMIFIFNRHEPPVTGNPLKIIALTDEVVVLDKPSSIPV